MPRTVKIGVDDACSGLEAASGRVFPVRDHVAELPVAEAARFMASGRTDHLHVHKGVVVGWSPKVERAWERAFGEKEEVCS